MKKIVAIDCRPLINSPSGIPNFIVSFINNTIINFPDYQLYLLANEPFHEQTFELLPKTQNLTIVIDPLPIFKKTKILWFIFKLPFILLNIKPDYFFAPAFILPPVIPKGITTILTVPDFVYKEFKKTMSFPNKIISNLLNDRSIRKADNIWAISDYTKQEIEKYIPLRKSKDIFVGISINKNIYKQLTINLLEKEELLKKYSAREKVLLFVGTLEPRKNLAFLLSLMPKLSKLGYHLIIVGARGWGKTNIKDIMNNPEFPSSNITFTGFLTTEEIVKLYNISSIYVSTSLNEGFGLPQMEAMACGCPVISPKNSAMIEVVENIGELVEGWDPEVWIKTIEMVYQDRSSYIKKGLKKVESEDWNLIVKNLFKAIK